MQIRKASVKEAPAIVEMIKAAAAEGAFHSGAPSTEEFRKFAFENPPEGYLLLACETGNEIVGYVDSRLRRGVGLILGFYVKPAFRRKGFGKALLEATLESFRGTGCHKARLEVFADNHKAVDFYKRFSFAEEGFLRRDEEERDTLIMSKFL